MYNCMCGSIPVIGGCNVRYAGTSLRYLADTSDLFQTLSTNDTGEVIQWNSSETKCLYNVIELDEVNYTFKIKKKACILGSVSMQVFRGSYVGKVDWWTYLQVKVPSGSWSNVNGYNKIITLPSQDANSSVHFSTTFIMNVSIPNTEYRVLHATSDVSKNISIKAYAPVGDIPGCSGYMLTLHESIKIFKYVVIYR